MVKKKTDIDSQQAKKSKQSIPEADKKSESQKNIANFSVLSNKLLITIFLIIEILIIVLMYPNYKVTRNTNLARKYAKEGKFELSKKHYLILKGIYNDSETINFELGNVYFSSKDYKKALECYLIVFDAQKEPSSEILRLIGLCYVNLGQKEQALDYFKNTLEKSPNDSDANFYVGENLIQQKNYLDAAKCFQRIPHPENYGEKMKNYWREIEKNVLGELAEDVKIERTN